MGLRDQWIDGGNHLGSRLRDSRFVSAGRVAHKMGADETTDEVSGAECPRTRVDSDVRTGAPSRVATGRSHRRGAGNVRRL